MATEKIFQNDIRTELGRCTLRIYDTEADSGTPNLHSGDILGGVELEMGDTGQSGEGLPIGVFGSFFDLTFVDNFDNEFRSVFNENFSRTRYRVEFEFPSSSDLKTWFGWVVPDIQARPLSERTQENTASVTCADGLGGLKEDPPKNGVFRTTVNDYLVDVFADAHTSPDVVKRVDSRGNDPTTSDFPVGTSRLIPNESPLGTFSPRSGDNKGLEGDTSREQLENLCKTFHASAYQDVRIGAFAFVDGASIGYPLEGEKYDRGSASWSSFTFPDNRETIADPRDEDEDVLEPETSVRKVCVDTPNWALDPSFEQYDTIPSTNSLYWFVHDGAELRNSSKDDRETELDISGNPTPEVYVFIGVDLQYVDAVRVSTESDGDLDAPNVGVTVVYGDGSSEDFTTSQGPIICDLDPTKNTLNQVNTQWGPVGNNSLVLFNYKYELLQSEQVVQPDGSTETQYQRTDTICFVDDGDGRVVEETNNLNYVIELSDGSRATSDGYYSRRYQNVGNLARWRAINILSILKPGVEKLQNVALGQWLPLGTRAKFTKPGESSEANFVPQTGRKLFIGADPDTGTELFDIEINDEVDNLVFGSTTESASFELSLSLSASESVTS